MSKEKNKQLTKDETKVANRHIKKCSNLLENRAMQWNIKMRFLSYSSDLEKFKNLLSISIKCWCE